MLHGGEIYDKKIELDFSVNLNPNPCPEEVRETLISEMANIDKYPDITQMKFRLAVAEAENKLCHTDSITAQKVIGGNGASELIMAIVRSINPRKVLLPVPSFYGYRHALNSSSGVRIREYLLREENDFALTEDFISEIDSETDLVIIANPNNPTGKCPDEKILSGIVRKCEEMGTTLVVDECFLHLSEGSVSAAKYINENLDIYVINAYTKLFSIPGVRVGYAIASEKNIAELKRYLPEWNMSVFALKAGEVCAKILAETDYAKMSAKIITEQKKRMTEFFGKKGIKVYDSDTDFILIKSTDNLYERLLDKGILIRNCSDFSGLAEGFYRIAVKDAAAVDKLFNLF